MMLKRYGLQAVYHGTSHTTLGGRASKGRQVQSNARLFCIHLGPPVYRLHTRTTGCAGPVQLYRCNYFAEEVTRHPLAAENQFLLSDDGTASPTIRARRIARGEPETTAPGPHYRPDYHGRTCHGCDARNESARILHVVCRAGWQDTVRRSQFALDRGGVRQRSEEIVAPKADVLRARIVAGVRLVVNHAMIVPAEQFSQLAREFPKVAFVVINHCSLNHGWNQQTIWPDMCIYRRTMAELQNLWLASPDPHACWHHLFPETAEDRCVWWPNPVSLPTAAAVTKPDPPVALLTCRADVVKSIPATVLGMALAQRQRPELRLAVALSNTTIPKLCESTGGRFETWPYVKPDGFWRRLERDVSVVLQPSLSESFNYVALEAMAHGRPVVGSPAIAYLPSAWQVDPNDPEQIARLLLDHLDHYEARSTEARRVAVSVADRQNASYYDLIASLTRKTSR